MLTGIDQLWIAENHSYTAGMEFFYLPVVLDAFLCRVIASALDRYLEADLAIATLEMALCGRGSPRGITHLPIVVGCSGHLEPTIAFRNILGVRPAGCRRRAGRWTRC